MTYDYHSKSHMIVKDELENWLLTNQFKLPLEIITGNSVEMKRIVINILNFYDFQYYIPPTNQGVIRII